MRARYNGGPNANRHGWTFVANRSCRHINASLYKVGINTPPCGTLRDRVTFKRRKDGNADNRIIQHEEESFIFELASATGGTRADHRGKFHSRLKLHDSVSK